VDSAVVNKKYIEYKEKIYKKKEILSKRNIRISSLYYTLSECD